LCEAFRPTIAARMRVFCGCPDEGLSSYSTKKDQKTSILCGRKGIVGYVVEEE
jgi:hypothetical protein